MASSWFWRPYIRRIFVAPHVEIDARTGVDFILLTVSFADSAFERFQGRFLDVLLHDILVKELRLLFYQLIRNLSPLGLNHYGFARCYTVAYPVTTLIDTVVYRISQNLLVLNCCILVADQSFCWRKMPIYPRLKRVVADHILSNGVSNSLGAAHLYELVHNLIKFILHILSHSIKFGVFQLNSSLFCIMGLFKISRHFTHSNDAYPLFLFFLKL